MKDENISSLVNKDVMSDVSALFSKMEAGNEFEFMFSNFNNTYLSYEKYLNIMEYISKKNKISKLPLETNYSLDVIYSDPEMNSSYRISINGMENINKYMQMLHKRKSHVVFKVLIDMFIEGNKDFEVIKKIKNKESFVDINDLDIRVRLAEELAVTKKELDVLSSINETALHNIVFRFKQRASLFIQGDLKDKDTTIRIDCTLVRMTKVVNQIDLAVPRYELELEYLTSKKPTTTALNTMLKESELLLKILQQSNFIATNTMKTDVINNYAKLLSLNMAKETTIDGRQAVSLELQAVSEFLADKYAVTDKADGDRYFLVIFDNNVYLISFNLNVKYTGIVLDKKLSKYNNTILDGEYIFLPKKNRHLYMTFDCLFKGGEDVRKENSFMNRIKHADEVIENCFIFDKQVGFKFESYDFAKKKVFDLEDVSNFHTAQIKRFVDNLNKDIEIEKKMPLIRRKYFIDSLGAKSWEIFKYSTIIWNKYTINCPYLLDGLIYHPLNQSYITNARESNMLEYKWKPPEKNSIDFYITFEKDRSSGKIVTAYDNSKASEDTKKKSEKVSAGEDVDETEHIRNKPYRICYLNVGQFSKFGEEPTLFRKEEGKYIAYLFLENGEVRDTDGNIISDKTVVEFYYENNPDIEERFRWKPIRTRYDKTEAVMRFKKRYGNYITVANKVWRSIVNPILMSDFDELARGNNPDKNNYMYDRKMEDMRSKINKELVISTTTETAYYQVKTNLIKVMRQFHNFMKSVLIYTHCHYTYQNNRQLTILEYGVGRGGDLMKYYYTEVAYLVGFDRDLETLVSAVDGATNRYEQLRKTHPNFPKMDFIHADGGTVLDYDEQNKVLGGMSLKNKQLMEKYFSPDVSKRTMFDRISCQFAMHYFLKNSDTWNGLKKNLNMYLKPSGYFMITTFDAEGVIKLLKNKDKFTTYYTTPTGEKKILFEIIKKYNDADVEGKDKVVGLGQTIDIFGAWMFLEGTYVPEYLVDKNFIQKEFLKDCDLELIDTDTFGHQFELHRNYLLNYAKFEENEKTRKFLLDAAEYYHENEINKGCHVYTNLTRYYVFRKKDGKFTSKEHPDMMPKHKPKKLQVHVQKGGGKFNLDDGTSFVIDDMENKYFNNSFMGSVYEILKNDAIIPNSTDIKSFYNDLKLKLTSDKNLDKLKTIAGKLYIEHDINGKKKVVMNGVSICVLEKDCNNDLDVDVIGQNKDKYMLLLKDGDNFKPVYAMKNNERVGVLDSHSDIMHQLLATQ